jgi:tyrosine-protein kinase Etk/Wzc
MTTVAEELDTPNLETEESGVAIKKFISKVASLWPWMLLLAIVLGIAAKFKLRYTDSIYTATATVAIQDDRTRSGSTVALDNVVELGGKRTIDNEIQTFKSYTLMANAVQETQLNVNYFFEGRIKETEIYNTRPVDLFFLDNSKTGNGEYTCLVDAQKRQVTFTNDDKSSFRATVGDTIALKEGRAILTEGPGFKNWGASLPLIIKIFNISETTGKYLGSLDVQQLGKNISILTVSINDHLPERAELLINNLTKQYTIADITDKSRMADSTIKFINERINIVSDELFNVEKNIQDFKVRNKITTVEEQSSTYSELLNSSRQKALDLETQRSVIMWLEEYLNNNQNQRKTIPSTYVSASGVIAPLVTEYNSLQLLRDKKTLSQTEDNPGLINIDKQLTNVRVNLLGNLSTLQRELDIKLSSSRNSESGYEGVLSTIPEKQRILLDLERQKAIKQELYVYLLKRKEEVAISKAATKPSARILDPASSYGIPKNQSIFFAAVLVGLAIPLGISYAKDFLNSKVQSLDDIRSNTSVPVLGEIGHNPSADVVTIKPKSRSILSERLRALRTNLQYLMPEQHQKVILITSSMSGEGKSFLSVNLAETIALAEKKVLLMELDLRKPKITQNLSLQKHGLTNFIVDSSSDWKKWIQRPENTSFDVLSCGPVPPNPSELLLLPKVSRLISELRAEYDYIIMDTAPVGLVTDAQVLSAFADLTLFVVRHNYTMKPQLKLLEKTYNKKLLPKLNIIVNDIVYQKNAYAGYYAYDYYGYAYGYGEYIEENKKK